MGIGKVTLACDGFGELPVAKAAVTGGSLHFGEVAAAYDEGATEAGVGLGFGEETGFGLDFGEETVLGLGFVEVPLACDAKIAATGGCLHFREAAAAYAEGATGGGFDFGEETAFGLDFAATAATHNAEAGGGLCFGEAAFAYEYVADIVVGLDLGEPGIDFCFGETGE